VQESDPGGAIWLHLLQRIRLSFSNRGEKEKKKNGASRCASRRLDQISRMRGHVILTGISRMANRRKEKGEKSQHRQRDARRISKKILSAKSEIEALRPRLVSGQHQFRDGHGVKKEGKKKKRHDGPRDN